MVKGVVWMLVELTGLMQSLEMLVMAWERAGICFNVVKLSGDEVQSKLGSLEACSFSLQNTAPF